MMHLESYLSGAWRRGAGDGRVFVNPTTGEAIGQLDSTGLDLRAACDFARQAGAALRTMSFAERGASLGGVADALAGKRAEYLEIARINSGNTARDASIDVDGAIGTLKFYARLGKTLGNGYSLIEDGAVQLTKSDQFKARHLWTSRPGVAVCINAFNFPAWGLWEKFAVAFLSGVPVLAKPASATAWLAERMVRDVVAANVLSDGCLSLVCGSADGLLEAVDAFDGILFTGSSETGRMIRSHATVLATGPRVAIEADSVNVAVLGDGAKPGSETFNLLVREAVGALSVKAGQMCTNIRRFLIPAAANSAFIEALAAQIDRIVVGDPTLSEVSMGPLVNESQRTVARTGLAKLMQETKIVRGGDASGKLLGADAERGAFFAPTLLAAEKSDGLRAVHDVEVFGPVATVIPYEGFSQAVSLALKGAGSLVASIWCGDAQEAAKLAVALAPLHGRVLCVDSNVDENHSGHAIVMPQCVHGGPGRAGGGEELGAMRGLRFHMQRTALQGSPAMLEAVASQSAVAAL